MELVASTPYVKSFTHFFSPTTHTARSDSDRIRTFPIFQTGSENLEARDGDDACEVREVWVEDEGKFVADEGFKVEGEKRLKLLLAVKADVARLKFRYYFESFGEVVLPGPAGAVEKAA